MNYIIYRKSSLGGRRCQLFGHFRVLVVLVLSRLPSRVRAIRIPLWGRRFGDFPRLLPVLGPARGSARRRSAAAGGAVQEVHLAQVMSVGALRDEWRVAKWTLEDRVVHDGLVARPREGQYGTRVGEDRGGGRRHGRRMVGVFARIILGLFGAVAKLLKRRKRVLVPASHAVRLDDAWNQRGHGER